MSWINSDKERDQLGMMPVQHLDTDRQRMCKYFWLARYVCRPLEHLSDRKNRSAVSVHVGVGLAISVESGMYLYMFGRHVAHDI